MAKNKKVDFLSFERIDFMNDEFLKNALPWVLFAFGIIVFTIVAKNKNRNTKKLEENQNNDIDEKLADEENKINSQFFDTESFLGKSNEEKQEELRRKKAILDKWIGDKEPKYERGSYNYVSIFCPLGCIIGVALSFIFDFSINYGILYGMLLGVGIGSFLGAWKR